MTDLGQELANRKCPTCGGAKVINTRPPIPTGHIGITDPQFDNCPDCKGSGFWLHGQKTTKTYTEIDPTGLRCKCTVKFYSHDSPPEYDACGRTARFALDIESVTVDGLKRRNRVAFCERHIPARYRQWFPLARLIKQER